MKMMTLRVEESEKTQWETAAMKAEMKLSEWMREILNEKAGVELSSEMVKVREQVKKVKAKKAPICAPEDPPSSPPICAPEAESRTRKPSAERRFACARCKRIGVPSCDECRKLNEKR